MDGGGGTSTGGGFAVTGAIGQPDAAATSGGNFTLQVGFRGIVAGVVANIGRIGLPGQRPCRSEASPR